MGKGLYICACNESILINFKAIWNNFLENPITLKLPVWLCPHLAWLCDRVSYCSCLATSYCKANSEGVNEDSQWSLAAPKT